MRLFKYKREKTIGTYNLGEYQVYVCDLSDKDGNLKKGITIVFSDSFIEIPFLLNEEESKGFSEYLTRVSNGELPSKYAVRSGFPGFLENIVLKFNKLKNGYITGAITVSSIRGFRLCSVWVSPSSLAACGKALEKLYSNA
ncbi:MAG: hypothetical protein U1F12_03265 [Pseudomonadales bacterium]